MKLEFRPSDELEELQQEAEENEDWFLAARVERELERRDYDESDPYPVDFSRDDPDGYDRNGAFDGFQVVSDADPGL